MGVFSVCERVDFMVILEIGWYRSIVEIGFDFWFVCVCMKERERYNSLFVYVIF